MSGPNERFILYESVSCPHCVVVKRAIDRLGVRVEVRNVSTDPAAREELLAARGRRTVPVLRLISSDGSDSWLPESRAIVAYLERHAAGSSSR